MLSSYYRDFIEELVPFINKILEQENGFSVAEDILTAREDNGDFYFLTEKLVASLSKMKFTTEQLYEILTKKGFLRSPIHSLIMFPSILPLISKFDTHQLITILSIQE